MYVHVCVCVDARQTNESRLQPIQFSPSDYFLLPVRRTNQALDKHVGDSTDSDNEEKEGRTCRHRVEHPFVMPTLVDGELEEGEVEDEFNEIPQQKDGMYGGVRGTRGHCQLARLA